MGPQATQTQPEEASSLKETICEFVTAGAGHKWRSGRAFPQDWMKRRLLRELYAATVQFSTHRIKRRIRGAIQQALRCMVTRLGAKIATQAYEELWQMGIGGKRRRMANSLPRLKRADGARIAGVEQLDAFWFEYFNTMEAGTIKNTWDFIRDFQPEDSGETEVRLCLAPALQEVEGIFRRQPSFKACGLDVIPGEVLKAKPVCMAKLYHPLYAKSVLNLCRPIQWRGGQLYECYKGTGKSSLPQNYRSLYISSVVGKGLHKLRRQRVPANTQSTFHDLQCGTRPGVAVTVPELMVQLMMRWARAHKRPITLLFLDTRMPSTALYGS